MLCKKCPHHVRHGQVASGGGIEFKDKCGIKMRRNEVLDCIHFPFPQVFDYTGCEVYLATFKSGGLRNDVVPTKDFQYSDVLSGNSITDMELL